MVFNSDLLDGEGKSKLCQRCILRNGFSAGNGIDPASFEFFIKAQGRKPIHTSHYFFDVLISFGQLQRIEYLVGTYQEKKMNDYFSRTKIVTLKCISKCRLSELHYSFSPLGPSINYVVSVGSGQGIAPKTKFTAQTLLNKKGDKGGGGSKIADFETTQFMDGPFGGFPCHFYSSATWKIME